MWRSLLKLVGLDSSTPAQQPAPVPAKNSAAPVKQEQPKDETFDGTAKINFRFL